MLAGAFLWVHQHRSENCLRNGNFAGPELEKAWTTWGGAEGVRFETLPGQGPDGSPAVSIAGARSASYLQTIPARAGERFLCVAWARTEPSDAVCVGHLSVRFRDLHGRWHARADQDPHVQLAAGSPGWQPLALVIQVPENAGGLSVILSAERQAQRTRILFSNVALYRLSRDQ